MRLRRHTVIAALFVLTVATAVPGAAPLPAPRLGAQEALSGAERTDDGARLGSVAVIPFTNISQDAADDWLGEGIAETVVADLQSGGGFTVIGGERVRAAFGDRFATQDEASIIPVARRLAWQWVVTGGYQRLGDMLRINRPDGRGGQRRRRENGEGGWHARRDLRPARPDRRRDDRHATGRGREPCDAEDTRFGQSARRCRIRGRARRDGRYRHHWHRRVGRSRGPAARRGDRRHHPAGWRPGASWVWRWAAGRGRTSRCEGRRLGRHPHRSPQRDRRPRGRSARIDGRLDDLVWQGATRITEFVQQNPSRARHPPKTPRSSSPTTTRTCISVCTRTTPTPTWCAPTVSTATRPRLATTRSRSTSTPSSTSSAPTSSRSTGMACRAIR